jgi:hypothetical protein
MRTPAAPRLLAGLALPLLLALCAALAGCGSSSARNVSGTWGGTITEPQMGAATTLTVADVYLQLQQTSDGQLTGQANLCHGVFGDHPAQGVPIQGSVKAPDQVSIQFQQFALHGTAISGVLTFAGTFPVSGTPTHNLATTLHPISANVFAAACAGKATPTP